MSYPPADREPPPRTLFEAYRDDAKKYLERAREADAKGKHGSAHYWTREAWRALAAADRIASEAAKAKRS